MDAAPILKEWEYAWRSICEIGQCINSKCINVSKSYSNASADGKRPCRV